jgi:uncharacterized protein DUF4383
MKTSSFALVLGVVFLALGVLGLAPATLMPPPAETPPTTLTFLYGYLLGLFPTNIVLTLLRIGTGIWALMAAASAANAARFARGVTLLYGVLTLLGMIPILNTAYGWMPVHGNDVWLHALTTAVAAYFGWRTQPAAVERRSKRLDRRHRIQPVAQERRLGLADRRFVHARMMAGI